MSIFSPHRSPAEQKTVEKENTKINQGKIQTAKGDCDRTFYYPTGTDRAGNIADRFGFFAIPGAL